MHCGSVTPFIRHHRLLAALHLRRQSIRGLARVLAVSEAHFHLVLRGTRKPSIRLMDSLKRYLGAEAFAFVLGESNHLHDAADGHTAAAAS